MKLYFPEKGGGGGVTASIAFLNRCYTPPVRKNNNNAEKQSGLTHKKYFTSYQFGNTCLEVAKTHHFVTLFRKYTNNDVLAASTTIY